MNFLGKGQSRSLAKGPDDGCQVKPGLREKAPMLKFGRQPTQIFNNNFFQLL